MSRKPLKIWKIVAIPIVMLGFAFAMVPLYNTFCDLTGFNGRSNSLRTADANVNYEVDANRQIKVSFVTQVAAGMPITFKAQSAITKIYPGQMKTMIFEAENRSNKRIIGQAIPSVIPSQAAIHFKKLECFCFQKQEFSPGEKVKMPVRFTIDPEVDSEILDVSLSYTFYYIESEESSEESVIRIHNEDFSEVKQVDQL